MIDSSQPLDKMLPKILLISMCCAAVYGSGQLSIVYAPKSLQFKQTATPLPSSSLSEVYAAALGYPVIGSVDWSALTIKDPFGTPAVAVAVIVSGDDAALSVGKVTYQLSGDGAHGSIDELYTRLPKTEHLTLTAVSEDKTIAADVKKQKFVALKPESNAAERDFVAEVADLATLADRIEATPEHSVFVATSLPLDALAGSSSAARAEAQKLIVRAVEKLSASLQAKFNGEVLLTLVSVEEETVVQRSKRQATGEATTDLNLAESYNEDYPIVFNIILWFGVVFVFSLVAISYAIGNMDPGRDSIIYRMTSTRIKKDN